MNPVFAKKKVHLVGVKGVGVTALAQILVARGALVSGSDTEEVFFTDRVLQKIGLNPTLFAKENITDDLDYVISSTAYFFDNQPQGENPEIAAALTKKIPILTYPEALAKIAQEYKVIAVAGSNGKSTTTAMLGWILEAVGVDPTVLVGTKVLQWESNARVGQSEYLIIEADEYREAFLEYQPDGLIILNINYDHPDYFSTEQDYEQAFVKLVRGVDSDGFILLNGDNPKTTKLKTEAKTKKVFLFGSGENADWKTRTINLPSLPGKAYQENANAAVYAAHLLGISIEKAVAAVEAFPGTARRFEIVTQNKDYTLIDDYAHHPDAIEKTLEGIRSQNPEGKIIALFQPHTFSRTKALLQDFARSFSVADEVAILPTYTSARETVGEITSQMLVAQIQKYHPNAKYLEVGEVSEFVKTRAGGGAIILGMGAGNIGDILRKVK